MLISLSLLWHESNGVVAGDGALVQVRSCETLVILITSTGELLLYFTVILFLFHLKKKQCYRIISVLSWVALFLLQDSYSSGLDFVNQD